MPLRVFKYVFSKFSTDGRRDGTPTQCPCFVLHKWRASLPPKAWGEAMQLWRENSALLNGGGQVQGKQALGNLHKWNINCFINMSKTIRSSASCPLIHCYRIFCQTMHMSTCVVDLYLENWDFCSFESKLVKAISFGKWRTLFPVKSRM